MLSQTADCGQLQEGNASGNIVVMPIENMILSIHGQQVILDRDLARLYQVETSQMNRQVKRNIERFPDDFRFQLTKEEFDSLKCQNGISNRGGDRRELPYAFTEQGVAMLSGLLRSDVAIKANIAIMRAFVAMRRFLATNAEMFQRLSTLEYHQIETDKRMEEVFRRLDEGNIKPSQGIFYDGQIYDAYTFVSDLIKSATSSILLIDNYVDDTVLTLFDKRQEGVSATIYTQQISRQFSLDVDRHNAQYAPIEVRTFRRSHDRFLCIDDTVYHIGASIKDLGKRWCAFSRMEILTPDELIERLPR